jgi:hypothetical protein
VADFNPSTTGPIWVSGDSGKPNQGDFHYQVPKWNTELRILFWLAEQNEFKTDDTLAQAIAMDNGLWVTMGDDEVKQSVYKDINSILNFGRVTSEWQKAIGLPYNLEDYPLEAKVCWAWTGGDPNRGGAVRHNLFSDPTRYYNYIINIHHLKENKTRQVNLKDYIWNTLNPANLPIIRDIVVSKWFGMDPDTTANNIANKFRSNWQYTSPYDDLNP